MKIFSRVLLVLCAVALVTAAIIALLYVEENVRGARRWAAVRHELEGRGESFEAARFIPPMVPDEQNLAMAPFFVRLYQYRVDPATGLLTFHHEGNTHAAQTIDLLPFGKGGAGAGSGAGWTAARPADLSKLQAYYQARGDFPHPAAPAASAAEEVLTALTRFQPLFDELAEAAAARPLVRFPVNWTQQPASRISLPQDNAIMKLISFLRLRASAALAAGQPEAALRDIHLGLRLREAPAREPILIGCLIDTTCEGLLMQPIWEGLQARCWNAAQLAALQAALSQDNVLANFRRSVQAERAFFILPMVDELRQAKDLNVVLSVLGGDDEASRNAWPYWMSVLNRWLPRGWYDEAKAVVSELDQRYTIDAIQVEAHRLDARRLEEGNRLVHDLPVKPSTFMAKLVLPVASSAAVKIARGQTVLDEVVASCALERFYLDRQSYPADLAALVPDYLARVPTDVIDGSPLRYERTAAGRYRLWAVGWNGRDEGGKLVWQDKTVRPDDRQGDWTWQYTLDQPPNVILGH